MWSGMYTRKAIGYDVRLHARQCIEHGKRLLSAPVFAGAVSLEEAEELLMPRTLAGRKKRRKE